MSRLASIALIALAVCVNAQVVCYTLNHHTPSPEHACTDHRRDVHHRFMGVYASYATLVAALTFLVDGESARPESMSRSVPPRLQHTPLIFTQLLPRSKAHVTAIVHPVSLLLHLHLTYPPDFSISPLSASQQYSGPPLGSSNICQCSSVASSMVAACGACQGGSVA